MNKTLRIVCALALMSASLHAAVKHEMRATYIATTLHIDWPYAQTEAAQQAEMSKMLDSVQALNFNTVFFQVRSTCDAMYRSAYEPWTHDLRSNRGKDPGWDPLQFVIDECRERGLNCFAWLNPYRYSRSGAGYSGGNNTALNYENTHPEWLLHYSRQIILDPGLPEVRQRIKEVVGDLLSKYDVDGIIFDDYFYPYGGTSNEDEATAELYKPANMTIGDWRRQNVNKMVAEVYDTIKSTKPWVEFGLSPFGIWITGDSAAVVARREGITPPTGITGGNMYEEIYCDPVAWIKQGTVDFISPQLYWAYGTGQDYGTLSAWWADLCNQYGVHFYSSMGNYKYAEQSDARYTVSELMRQVDRNRVVVTDNAAGTVFYNTRAWYNDEYPGYSSVKISTAQFQEERSAMHKNQFSTGAIRPALNWYPTPDQTMVTFSRPRGQKILWIYDADTTVHYAVYAVPNAERNTAHVFSKSDYLLGISFKKEYTLPDHISTSTHKIAVSVVDRYGNEYSLRVLGETLTGSPTPATLTNPSYNARVNWPVVFQWEEVEGADSYVIQIATDASFQHIVAAQETTDNFFYSTNRRNLAKAGDNVYYWRIRTRRANVDDCWSDMGRFVTGNANSINEHTKPFILASMQGGMLHLDAAIAGEARVEIYTPAGQLVSRQAALLTAGSNTLYTGFLPQGLYLIRLSTADTHTTLKVVNR